MTKYLLLALEFFKTGLFSVGGGLATIPFLTEMGEKYGWFTIDTLSTMIAISESTPGAMGVNMATYVGYTVGGLGGSILATLSLVAPSIIVICIIANYFQKFKNAKFVKEIFAGLKPAVVAFIASACLSLFMSTLFNVEFPFGKQFFDLKCIILFIILFILRQKYQQLHPIVFIVSAALCGIIFKF
ncbi:MAG: chromate transporter [Traorella sp.]